MNHLKKIDEKIKGYFITCGITKEFNDYLEFLRENEVIQEYIDCLTSDCTKAGVLKGCYYIDKTCYEKIRSKEKKKKTKEEEEEKRKFYIK